MRENAVIKSDKESIRDALGRSFKTLRISVNDICNLACTYCVGEKEGFKIKSGKKVLTSEEFSRVVTALSGLLDIGTIRLTGGEPLLYKEITALVASLKHIGIRQVKLTTNGVFLKKYASALMEAGIDAVNVSLDAVDEEVFYRMTRRKDLDQVLAGIEEAAALGIPVKLNCVVMKGVNEDQILPLLDYASKHGLVLRFLELMKMGPLRDTHGHGFVSEEEILKVIGKKYSLLPLERTKGATARYWMTDTLTTFGIISNTSAPFCHDCDRLRLDSRGNIYGCLSSGVPLPVMDCLHDKELLKQTLLAALGQKKTTFTGSALSMKYIGG